MVSRVRFLLLVVDKQTRPVPVISGSGRILKRNGALPFSRQKLDVPVVFTEQYPKDVRRTLPRLPGLAGNALVYEKFHFNTAAETEFLALLPPAGWQEIVVTGTRA